MDGSAKKDGDWFPPRLVNPQTYRVYPYDNMTKKYNKFWELVIWVLAGKMWNLLAGNCRRILEVCDS